MIYFDNFDLPNFTKLRNNSVTHDKMFAPSLHTFWSVPSMLIGEYADGAKFVNHRYTLITKDKKEIPFVVMAGEEEMTRNEFKLKNMKSGVQTVCNRDELIRLSSS